MVQVTNPTQGRDVGPDSVFGRAPPDWTPAVAQRVARDENLELTDDGWDLVRALHEFYARHEGTPIRLTELHDALEEKFHHKGGFRFLYTLLPGGPIAQGCRLAGVPAPSGASDRSFGSVA